MNPQMNWLPEPSLDQTYEVFADVSMDFLDGLILKTEKSSMRNWET